MHKGERGWMIWSICGAKEQGWVMKKILLSITPPLKNFATTGADDSSSSSGSVYCE